MTKNDQGLLMLAKKYIWWKPPEEALLALDALYAQVLELGTWKDVEILLAIVDKEQLIRVLKNPPKGVISEKSSIYWFKRFNIVTTSES